MPRRIDPHARGQQVYEAVRDLVREGGIEAVSVRAVAAQAALASSSLRQQYRDKDFLLRCIVHEVTDRLNRATYSFRPGGEPVQDVVDLLSTQLARHDEARADGRVWLALVERSRAIDDDTRLAIREQRDDWLTMSTQAVRHLGVAQDAQDLDARRLALLLEALVGAVCDPTYDLDREGAVEVLERHARELHRTSTLVPNAGGASA